MSAGAEMRDDIVESLRVEEVTEQVKQDLTKQLVESILCLLYTSPSPRDRQKSRMPSSA